MPLIIFNVSFTMLNFLSLAMDENSIAGLTQLTRVNHSALKGEIPEPGDREHLREIFAGRGARL